MTLGQATHQLSHDPVFERGISQMFVAINPGAFGPEPKAAEIIDSIVASLHNSKPATEGKRVRYPGEETLRIRAENRKLGLPVERAVWSEIQSM
jgi:3-dehydro-L-gulonate 2-dehydrogenase